MHGYSAACMGAFLKGAGCLPQGSHAFIGFHTQDHCVLHLVTSHT